MSNLNRPALARNVAAGQQASMGAKRMGQVGYRAAGQGIPATSQYFSPDHGFGGSNLRRLRNESAKPNDPLFGDQFDMDMDAGMDDDDTGMGSPRPQLPHHGNPFPGQEQLSDRPSPRPIGGPMPMPRGPRPTGGTGQLPGTYPGKTFPGQEQQFGPNTPWMPGDPWPSPYRPIGGPMPMPGGPRPRPTTPALPVRRLRNRQVPNQSGSPHAYGAFTAQTPFDQRGPGTSMGLGGVTGSPGAQGPPGQAGAAGPSGMPPQRIMPPQMPGPGVPGRPVKPVVPHGFDPASGLGPEIGSGTLPTGAPHEFPPETDAANDRLESDRAQMQMEQERLESERTGGPRVAPQFNRRPRRLSAFRPVNRL